METKKYYTGIDGIRAMAAIGIILMHVKANSSYNINSVLYNDVIGSFGRMVNLFFIISAFSMCTGYYEKVKNSQIDLNNFYIKRIKKILPYFAVLVVIDLMFSFWDLNSLIEGIADLTLLYGFLPNSSISVIGVGWALGVIFAFYWLFPAFVFAINTKKRAWVTFLISVYFYFVCNNYFLVNGEAVQCNFLYWMVFFVVGGLIYLYRDSLTKIVSSSSKIVLIAWLGLVVLYYYLNIDNQVYELAAQIIIFSVILIYAVSVESRFLSNRVFKFLSSISLEIYLGHMLFFRLAQKLHITELSGNGVLDYIITCLIVIAGVIVFAVVVRKIFEVIDGYILKLKKAKVK